MQDIKIEDIFESFKEPETEEEKKREAERKLKRNFPGLFIPKKD
jgi:hypothetical protein